MRWKGDNRTYGAMAMTMHWATAAAIFALFGSGTMLERLVDDATRTQVLRVHAVTGSLVVLLTLARIAWWAFAERKPAEPNMPRWQSIMARLAHWLLYALILIMGASGVAMLALSGAAEILFLGQPGPLPDFHAFPPRAAHGLASWLLIGLIAVHIGAALYHQIMLGDRLLARMGLGRAH